MTEIAHSRLGASGAYRWIPCPGSIRMTEGMKDEGNTFAREGSAAHTLAERCLRGGFDADRFFGEEITYDGETFEINEEMVEGVQLYLDTVRGTYEAGDLLIIEQKFSLEILHPGMFGTCDAVIYRPRTGELFVFDFKYGVNAVEVVGNPQLRYYGLGAAISEEGRALGDVHLIVVQPRSIHADGPVRWDKIDSMELLEWSGDLIVAAEKTKLPDAPLNPGSWCDYCLAAGTCPALRAASLAAARMEFDVVEEMSPEVLAGVLDEADMIADRVRAVKAYVFSLMEQGVEIPGWKMVEKRPMRKWADEEGAIAYVKKHGVEEDELYTRKFRSPAQIEKLLPKALRKDLNDDYVIKESSGNTFARIGDKREAVNIENGSEFDVITEN